MPKLLRSSCRLGFSLCSALLLLVPYVAWAQVTSLTNATSVPTPGTGHDYIHMLTETVNPANGSVSVRIQIPMPPGRGLTIPFSFAYDSTGALHLTSSNAVGGWTSNQGYLSQGGWSYSAPMLSVTPGSQSKTVNGIPKTCNYINHFMFYDPSGGPHQLWLAMSQNQYTNPDCYYFSQVNISNHGDDYYSAHLAVDSPGVLAGTTTVASADGTVYSFRVPGSHCVTNGTCFSLPTSITDRNGNQVTVTDQGSGAFYFTDTVGRQVLTSNGFGATGNQVTVQGLGGPYVITWGSANVGFTTQDTPIVSTNCGGISSPSFSIPVITDIKLPNLQHYTFQYDPTYGLLTEIKYPTGAKVDYDWETNTNSDVAFFANGLHAPLACIYLYGALAVHHRYVEFDGQTPAEHQDAFVYTTNWNGFTWNTKTTTHTATDAVRTLSSETDYTYSYVSVPNEPNDNDAFATQIPVESKIDSCDWGITGCTSSNSVRTVKKTWADQYDMSCQSTTQGGLTSRIDYSYRSDYLFGATAQVTDKKEWDWGQAPDCASAASGTPLRESVTHYPYPALSSPYYTAGPSIFDRPDTVTVNGSGTEAAQTTYGLDSVGNALSKTQKCLYNCTADAVTQYTYDGYGNVHTMEDPNQNTTTYTFSSSSYQGAYLTQIAYPSTNGVQHVEYFTYNFTSGGELASSTDLNGGVTNYTYNDSLGRLTQATGPGQGSTAFDGVRPWPCSPSNPQTTYNYSDGPLPGTPVSVQTSKLLCGSTLATSTNYMDGLGRVTETLAPNGAETDTPYDGSGHVMSATNPYFTNGDSTYGVTQYSYDALGRPADVGSVHAIQRPDGNYTSITYSGNCATTVDEAGKPRTTCTDALGRISQVTDGLGNTTTYQHDALDNLTSVLQGAQTRTFVYDSLSRLTSAANPESGTVHYTYDPNGNMQTRLDGRGITTTYWYDALNRQTSKTYSDSTPPANFFYDETSVSVNGTPINVYATNGRLTHWTTTVGSSIQTEGIYSYNGVGGVQDFWECTPFDCATVSNNGSMFTTYYEYDLAGDLGFYVVAGGGYVYPYVNGAQQVYQVTSTFYGAPNPLAQNIAYAATGAVATLQDGCTPTGNCTPLQEKWTYNSRLQPVMVQVGTSNSPNSVSCDAYYYYSGFSPPAPGSCPTTAPTSGTGNNGNLMGWSHWDGGGGGSGVNNTTSYSYDAVNRLSQATIPNHYAQNYSYDAYGNMSCSGNYCATTLTFDPNTTTNRIKTINGSSAGVSYDAAGNLTGDGSASNAHTFQWDAENRLISVDNGNTASFAYNALGQRVEKIAGGQTTYYYHDSSGNIAMNEITSLGQTHVHEYFFPSVAGRNFAKYYWTGSAWETDYLHPNPLGSSQVVTRADGSPAEYEIFFPYGGVRWYGGGTQDVRYASMQERDGETTTWQDPLDPTPNRMYTSGLGRWLTPDPAAKKAVQLDDPQTWNMYAYLRNNPTTLTDPTGLSWWTSFLDKFWVPLWFPHQAAGDPPPEPRQHQKKQTVVFGDPGRTIQEKPGAAASRDVYYESGKVDEQGNISDIDRTSTLTLHEKLDPNSKTAAHICDKPCSAPEDSGGVFVDLQFVPAGGFFRVLRDWKVGSYAVNVFDPQSKKTFSYEVNTYDANAKTPLKTEYTDTPPF